MSIFVSHFFKFWYICAPALAATLFLIIAEIVRFFLSFRKEKDKRAALEAIAQLNGISSKDADELKMVYDLFGDERKGSICFLYGDKFIEVEPGSTSMSALKVYYGKYARAKKISTVAFYIFATGFMFYVTSLLAYCIYLQLIN